jgi:Zn-dependent M28 family amino/carboxypeptidase
LAGRPLQAGEVFCIRFRERSEVKTKIWLTASALAFAAVPLSAATVDGFDTGRLSQHVQTLGSDAFEGRGPATEGETKTVNYLVQQFQAAGLQPGGDLVNGQRKWTQDVPLLQSELAGDPAVTVQTPAGPMRLTQGNEIAVRSPTNGQDRLNLANAPLVFAGYGVQAPERNWDDFKGQDMHGKVLVVLVNDPDFEGGANDNMGGDFGGKAMTYYGRWTYKYEEAARLGAAGVMIVHETVPASYGWNTVKNSNTNTQFDIVRQDPTASHTPFETWIQRDTAVQLFRNAGLDFEAAKQAAKRRDFQPIDLKSTVNVSANAKVSTITSHNVVGIVPGKKYPNETVLYTAHWDHLGIGKPDATGDTIYNGAIDNGTGVSQLIEQGRAFAHGPRPDRTVVFMAVTAEEKGLLGSEYYATHPLYPIGLTAGMINTDVLGVLGPTRDFTVRGNQKFGLLDMLVEEAAKRGRRYTPDPHPETGGFFRSDHFTLAKVGVPALSFGSGQDLVNGGVARAEAWSKNYTATMYHQPADEFSPDWDFTGIAKDAALLHAVGERLANSHAWPDWSQDSEFRAARDQTASERGEAPAPPAPPTATTPRPGERG